MNFEQARYNMIEQQQRPWKVLDPEVSGEAARMGSAAFLDPQTRISPSRRGPPSI